MQNPTGFDLVDGKIVNPDPWAAIFTQTTFFMVSHSVLGYYLTTVLLVMAVFAWSLLRGKTKAADMATVKYIMTRLGVVAAVLGLSVGLLGHLSLQYLSKHEPRKFAAIELVPEARTHAPYIIGGSLSEDGKSVEGGIRIPYLLSILTGGSPNTAVPGLNSYPRQDWPMLFVNRLFEAKMVLVGLVLGAPLVFVGLARFMKRRAYSKPMLWALVAAAPTAFIVVELGWMIAEFGRQPFTVNGLLRTEQAFTANPGVIQWGYIFPTLFLMLFVVTIIAVRVVAKHFKAESRVIK